MVLSVATVLYSHSSDSAHNAPREWKEYTVFVACVGVGNVGQLACDLLINNLDCTLEGSLDFAYLPAVIGSNPYSHQVEEGHLMTCSQLYVNKKRKIAVLQNRAPPFPKCQKKHIEELVNFLQSSRFARVILLSSSFAMQRKDSELRESPLRFAVTENFSALDLDQLKSKQWPPLLPHTEDLLDERPANKRATPPSYRLLGCGIANRLFDRLALIQDAHSPVCLLNMFASEGDNAGDALYMVHQLNDWLNLMEPSGENQLPHDTWLPPPSWSLLYGTSALDSLY